MAESLELKLEALSHLELMELQEALESEGLSGAVAIQQLRGDVPAGALGEPGLITAFIELAPDILPAVAAAIVLWVGKARRGTALRARKISLSRSGFVLLDLEQTSFDNAANSSDIASIVQEVLANATK